MNRALGIHRPTVPWMIGLAFMLMPSAWAWTRSQMDSLNHLPFETRIKNPARLLPLYIELAAEAHKLGVQKAEAEAYENAGLTSYYLGKYDQALTFGRKAIEGFMQLGETARVARLHGEIGYRLKEFNMKLASAHMRRGIAQAEQNRQIEPLMGLYDNYGVLKEMQKDYDSAFYYYHKGLMLKLAQKDTAGLPYSYTNLGGLMLLQKKYHAAKSYFDQALTLRKTIGDSLGLCETYLVYSDLEAEMGKHQEAIETLDFVIAFCKTRMLYKQLSDAYRKKATLYASMGSFELALNHERKSRTFLDSATNIITRNRFADLQIQYETTEKEKQLISERLENSRFKASLWIVGFSAVVAILLAVLFYMRHKAEKRKLELQRLNDLEYERMRIARDLHDNIGAELSFITSKLDITAAKSSSAREQQEYKSMADMGREASALLRETIWTIRQPELETEALFEKMVSYADRRLPAHIELIKECKGSKQITLSSADALHLYRIAQECINNSVKYADCSRIEIKMNNGSLQICDNGKGFNVNQERPGYGLENIRHRAQEIGLDLVIKSDDNGTCIELCR